MKTEGSQFPIPKKKNILFFLIFQSIFLSILKGQPSESRRYCFIKRKLKFLRKTSQTFSYLTIFNVLNKLTHFLQNIRNFLQEGETWTRGKCVKKCEFSLFSSFFHPKFSSTASSLWKHDTSKPNFLPRGRIKKIATFFGSRKTKVFYEFFLLSKYEFLLEFKPNVEGNSTECLRTCKNCVPSKSKPF